MTLTAEQTVDIAAQREARHHTRRATAPALEAMLYEAIPVLDHGFVRVIDYMGDDAAVVQARGSATAAARARSARTPG